MSNTRTTFGEQATFDGLIAHTLTTLEEDGVTSLPSYALYKNAGLQSVIFPSVTSVAGNALSECPNLTTIEIGGKCSLTSGAFANSNKLTALKLTNTSGVSTLSNTSVITGSGLKNDFTGIYVPSSLLSNYKSASNWTAYADRIFPLEDYPKTDFGTISDSWSTIIANCDAGTIDDYNIGDTKQLDINGTKVLMQIVAKNTDQLADGTGTASLTWLAKNIYFTHVMNSGSTNTNGWEACALRTWLRGSEVFGALPTELQNGIKEVKKAWYDYTTKTTKTSTDTIWIPSTYEMFSDTTSSIVETGDDNVQYTMFNSNAKRVKSGSATYYWLRSAYTSFSNGFYIVTGDGSRAGSIASYSIGVVPGFCT